MDMKERPTIFLDIDGVLNSIQYCVAGNRWNGREWDPYHDDCCRIALSNLCQVWERFPTTQVVISSTWRLGRSIEDLQKLFRGWKFPHWEAVIGKTTSFRASRGIRGEEIDHYIKENRISRYCIIDDDSDMMEYQKPKFVKVNGKHGLMWDDIQKVISILS